MYKCPFCHSTDIETERDYNEIKVELKKILSENENDMPLELKKILNEAIMYDLYDDDEYLKNLEMHGITLICHDCGNIFKEKDEVLEDNYVLPKEISKEEFIDIIRNAIHSQKRTIVEVDTPEKEELFLKMVIGKRKKYYKEMAQLIIDDLENTSKMIDELEFEEENTPVLAS